MDRDLMELLYALCFEKQISFQLTYNADIKLWDIDLRYVNAVKYGRNFSYHHVTFTEAVNSAIKHVKEW